MSPTQGENKPSSTTSLPVWKKIIYGSGDFGISSTGLMRAVFYAIFLTDVVGLEPRIASFGALAGIIWDAINDPLVGILSDRSRSRFGRRRIFLLIFAIPFGLSFVLLWSAPRWESQISLLLFVTLIFMLVDTLSTLISVPFLSLTPEITKDYDERTSLAGFRTIFQLTASFSVVVFVPMITDHAIESGLTQQQGLMIAGGIFGSLSVISYFLIVIFIKESEQSTPPPRESFLTTLKSAWGNIPFRYAVGIYLLNGSAVDMAAVIFPYFLLYWISSGDLLAKATIFGFELALESAFFGTLMLFAIIALPFWLRFAKKKNKPTAYVYGVLFFVFVEVFIYLTQPGELNQLIILAAFAGIGISAAYILPDSIFPDIIEWDELRTRKRQEGVYYGARSFIRKFSGAMVMFLALQALGWAGYQNPPPDAVQFSQPASALSMIRILISPVTSAMLLIAAGIAWYYPLSREKHARIRRLLEKRREAKTEANPDS
jgi:GPH family glycoside/pentoside/hexuronide:cation symporter